MLLQKREKIILYLCLATLMGALLYVKLLEPTLKKFYQLQEELNGKKMLLEKSRQLLAQKDKLQKEYKMVKERLIARGSIEENLSKFLLRIENLAKESGIKQISSINPYPVKESEEYKILLAQVNLDSDLSGLTSFLYALVNSPYLLDIQKLQIDTDMNALGNLKSQVLISTIYFNPLEIVEKRKNN